MKAKYLILAICLAMFGISEQSHAAIADGGPLFSWTNPPANVSTFNLYCDGVSTPFNTVPWTSTMTSKQYGPGTFPAGAHSCFVKAFDASATPVVLATSNTVTFTVPPQFTLQVQ